MSAVEKWNPFREMEDLHNRLSSLWGLAPVRRGDNRDEAMTVADWSPLVDIMEDDKEYLIQADLPQVDKKDISVRVENGVLYISGERKQETEEKNRKYHRVERFYGNFVRSFSIPEDADPEKVSADFKDGVLRVRLGKSESARPKKIDIKVS